MRVIAGLSTDEVSTVIRAADDALPEDVALNPELLNIFMAGLLMFCDIYHYPREWATLPTEPAQESTCNQHFPNATNQIPASTINSYSSFTWNPSDAQNQHIEGGKKVIALVPRMTQRITQPRYTSTREEILYIQRLGENRARFVVEPCFDGGNMVTGRTTQR